MQDLKLRFLRLSNKSSVLNPAPDAPGRKPFDGWLDRFLLRGASNDAATGPHKNRSGEVAPRMWTALRIAFREPPVDAGFRSYCLEHATKSISHTQRFWFVSEAAKSSPNKRLFTKRGKRSRSARSNPEEQVAESGIDRALLYRVNELGKSQLPEDPAEHNVAQSTVGDIESACPPVPHTPKEAPWFSSADPRPFAHPSSSHRPDSVRPSGTTTTPGSFPINAVYSRRSVNTEARPDVLRRDFAYESSATPEGSPGQIRTSLHDSTSVTSFVVARNAESSPRSSLSGQTAFGTPRCESPHPLAPPSGRSSVSTHRLSSLYISTSIDARCHPADGACSLNYEHSCQLFGVPPALPEEIREVTADDKNTPSRKILIIGSTYESAFRKTATILSIETLVGFTNDMEQLKEAFKERNYSVETIGINDFHRGHVLARVATYLQEAKEGDVRAIAFIGHAYTSNDGTVMLIPPNCPNLEMAIPQADWEQNVRANSNPGVIIFSIMAHCFSGEFMKQEQDCRTWRSTDPSAILAVDKPIFITFVSSTSNQFTFESTVDRRDQSRAMDHFLYALVMAMKYAEGRTWETFFATFKVYFDKARSSASWAAADCTHMQQEEDSIACETEVNSPSGSVWRAENHQEPGFSASESVGYLHIF